MKKIKIMLASIAMLAVLGGAFAFKAKKAFGTNLFYTTSTVITTNCDLPLDNVAFYGIAKPFTTAVNTKPYYYSTQSAGTAFPVSAYFKTNE